MLKKKSIVYIGLVVLAVVIGALLMMAAIQHKSQDDKWKEKIDEELWEVMGEKYKKDLIEVYLWLKDTVDYKTIDQALIDEKGMDPAVYENEYRFNNEIVVQITKEVEERLGYEKAHKKGPDGCSPVDHALHKKVDEYVMARREIVKRKYSAFNDKFIEDNIAGKDRRIIYNSRYTSTLVVEATKAEIEAYANMDIVEGVSFYEELIQEHG